MRNPVERMDRIRARFLRIFVLAFGLLIGFWAAFRLGLALLRPKTMLSFDSASSAWKRYFDFLTSLQPAMKISIFAGFIILGVSLAIWLLYKRNLARNPALDEAVRDERVRLLWLISFRNALAGFVVLLLFSWIFGELSVFFFGRNYFAPETMYFLKLFVLIVMSLGTFIWLDRSQTELTFRFRACEAAAAQKALPLLAIYSGWHVLYLIGRIYGNWRLYPLIGTDPHFQRLSDITRGVRLAWIAVLGVAIYLLLRPIKQMKEPGLRKAPPDDERVRTNWLKACRFSLIFVLVMLLAPILPSMAAAILWSNPPSSLMATVAKWQYILSGLQLNLLAAVVVLLGSYRHYDRED
jgi:hypothetical protein